MGEEFNLGFINILELGNIVSEKLLECGVGSKSDLIIYLNTEEFKRVDEDLFYRNRKDESETFIPSDGEIDINFSGVKITIKEIENGNEHN